MKEMELEEIEEFYRIYQEIKEKYAHFIRKFKLKPIIHNLKLDKNLSDEQYEELFSSYATDMILANEFCEGNKFSISDFADYDKDFLEAFNGETRRLKIRLQKYEFCMEEHCEKELCITPLIFHDLGEKLVRKAIVDSGTVFTPSGVVKLLTMQTLFFFLKKATNFPSETILNILIDPYPNLLDNFPKEDIKKLYSSLKNIRVMDPACGTGLFFFEIASLLFRMYEIFPPGFEKVSLKDIFKQNLFGIDINPHILFKLRFLIQIFLYRSDGGIPNDPNFLFANFVCEDSLLVESDNPENYDIILGNPPYVRQENIRPQGILNLRMNRFELFPYKSAIIENITKTKDEDFRINKRSDLYIYFFYYALNHLRENGIVSFLTSNSWLNIGFGFEFQDFILSNSELCSIIDFDHRSFSSAEINTVITTLYNSPPSAEKETINRFINIRKSINPENISEILQKVYQDCTPSELKKFSGMSEYSTTEFQLRKMDQKLIPSGSRWGNELLLAPRIYYAIKEKLGSQMMKLGDIASITRGITTGLNDYFIFEKIEGFNGIMKVRNGYDYECEIESIYLKPFLVGPKRMLNSILNQEEIHQYVLHIPDDFNVKIPSLAANYIQYGKTISFDQTKGKMKGKSIYGAHNVPTLKGKKKFYAIKLPQNSIGTQIFIQKIFSSKYKVYYSPSDDTIWANNTFYNINIKPEFKEYFSVIVASLLSSITYLSIELNGRRSFGMGALDTATFDIENIMVVDPRLLGSFELNEVKKCLKSISSREFLEVAEEFEMEDRKKLDKILLEQLNLVNFQQELYNGVLNLVEQRISKSQTYRKK
ncbi:MAG: hypothetical protein EU530_08230 [Promethearchaeota archaeon]|nr:MAG: hypothetical protein EU530_08230 [Candidatus Lokiarchaeota archaeon]